MKKVKKITTALCVVILMFYFTGCNRIADNLSSLIDAAQEGSPVTSLEECGFVPISAGNEGLFLISPAEESVLGEVLENTYVMGQWNSLGEKPAYYFYIFNSSDLSSSPHFVFYTSDGQFVGISYGFAFGSNGFAVLHTSPDEDGNYWSVVIDEKGKVITEVPSHEYVIWGWNVNGYALISEDSLYGYLDEDGDKVIDCQYTAATGFTEDGYACVSKDGETICRIIDNEGKEYATYDGYIPNSVVGSQYFYCYSEGYETFCILDVNGDAIFEDDSFFAGLYELDNDTLWCKSFLSGGYFLTDILSGNVLLEADAIDVCDNGLIIAYADEDWEIFDQNGDSLSILSDFTNISGISALLGGEYFNIIWTDENGEQYTGIIDKDGELLLYISGSEDEDTSETYNGSNISEEYEIVYSVEPLYTPGDSAWETAMAVIEAVLTGDSERCLSCFWENEDGTLGGTGMDADDMEELLTTIQESVEEDYGDYHVNLYISDYQDIDHTEIDKEVEGQVEAAYILTGEYQVVGSEDKDSIWKLEDNEFETTVIMADGVWYAWDY